MEVTFLKKDEISPDIFTKNFSVWIIYKDGDTLSENYIKNIISSKCKVVFTTGRLSTEIEKSIDDYISQNCICSTLTATSNSDINEAAFDYYLLRSADDPIQTFYILVLSDDCEVIQSLQIEALSAMTAAEIDCSVGE